MREIAAESRRRVDAFFDQTPLPDLLSAPIAAFQMDHKTHARLVQSELKRFNVVKDWLTEIRPELSHVLDEPSHFVSMRSGMINFTGEPVARLSWNGAAEVALLGKRKHTEVAVIRDQQYPEIFEALAVLALDIAEIRSAGLANMPLSCTAFSKTITELGRRLGTAGLLKPATIESASWWNPSGRVRKDWF